MYLFQAFQFTEMEYESVDALAIKRHSCTCKHPDAELPLISLYITCHEQ
jgi:hypothetical protein